MLDIHDTIVAVSSPPGRSLRGLVRLSGPDCHAMVSRLAQGPLPPPRRLTPLRLCGTTPDPLPALAALFRGPHSYTGQDMAELQVPGHPALLERLLEQFTQHGARPAQRGEFTLRAFLAGKMDLTQAEGVAAAIAADSRGQLHAAALLRRGDLGRLARQLVDALAGQLALVEAGIDFSDQEDVHLITPADLRHHLADLSERLTDLLSRCRSWASLTALPQVVLVGPPSAGKSTLFNALLGHARAVTSPLPGTTRDVLSEPMIVPDASGRPVEVLLSDVAGLDDPLTVLDRDMQAAARQAIASADLLLMLHDGRKNDAWIDTLDTLLIGEHRPSLLHVRTKIDQGATAAVPADALPVSALTGQGLAGLRQAIDRYVAQRGVSLTGEVLALQPRHEAALRSAAAHLRQVDELLATQTEPTGIAQVELVAQSMRAALDELAHLAGQVTPDELLGLVFARFCIGK